MIHLHKWVDETEHFTPPNPRLIKVRGEYGDKVPLFGIYGITVIKQRCSKCGKVRYEQTPGRVAQ